MQLDTDSGEDRETETVLKKYVKYDKNNNLKPDEKWSARR